MCSNLTYITFLASCFTADQTKMSKVVQRKAYQITVGGGTYTDNVHWLEILADRRVTQLQKLFQQVMNNFSHCLHY